MNLNKKKGFSILEMSIIIAILLTLGAFSYSNLIGYMEEERLKSEKNDIIQIISSNSRKSFYSNSNIYMYLNTDMSPNNQFKRGIHIFYPRTIDSINGEITGGYFDHNILNNNNSLQNSLPKIIFECDNPKSSLKFCPVVIFEKNNIPIETLNFSNKPLALKKIEFKNGNLSTNLTFYIFNSKGFFNRKIYFYTKNSILQVFSYIYKGKNLGYLKRNNDDENINKYHKERALQYPLGNDPDWEKEGNSLSFSNTANN